MTTRNEVPPRPKSMKADSRGSAAWGKLQREKVRGGAGKGCFREQQYPRWRKRRKGKKRIKRHEGKGHPEPSPKATVDPKKEKE